MPEYTYISHKVKKGETLYGISRQYTVEEHKILQANPEIKITPKGKGKYEIANLKEGQILRIPQKKKIGKRGVKAITGNTTPKAGIKEKYRVTEWYPGTPTEMKNPANVKWAVYYKEKGKYILKFKKEIGEFTFHEQAIGKDIKIVGYLYSPELDNDSALSVKVSPNQKPSLTSLTLYDVKKDKPLSQNAKLKLGQILYVVANTTGSVGKKIEFTLLKKEEKQGKTEYKTVTNTTEKVSTKGTATTAFPLNDYKLLVNPIKKHEYKVKAQLEEGNAKKDKPKQQPKKEESIIYKGTIFLKEGWNKFRETYKEMTTSEDPQIQKVSLYIPGNKSKVSYGEKLKLKIEGKNLKGQSIEYTVYEDDWPLKDELDSSIVQMKADVQELDIQLTKEMYKKGGTSWLELADGKHEIYVDVKLKGDILAKSTKIIEVDTSTIKMEPIPGNRAVMTGEDKKKEEKCPRCNKDFTLEEIKLVFTNASKSDLEKLLISLNAYRKKFELNTCAKKAHFFAQSIEESGRDLLGALEGEDFKHYTPKRLVEVFDTFRSKYEDYGRGNKRNIYKGMNDERLAYVDRKKAKPIAEAYLYGKTQGRETASNPIALANIAYSTKSDIGNQGGNDGWNFKGRGLLQVTGRGNYEKIQKVIDKLAPESKVNVFDSVPESGYTPHQAAITGMAEWVEKSLYALASQSTKNNDDKIVNNIVNVLNEKTDSRAKRIVHYRGGSATATISGSSKKVNYTAPKDKNGNPKYKSTKEIFKIDECILLTGEKKEKKEEGKRAPWVEVAWKEFETYKGLREEESPLKEKISKYFMASGNSDLNYKSAWCAAFVKWCFNQTDYKDITPKGSAAAYAWAHYNNSKVQGNKWVDGWKNGEKCEPFVGAIIVFNYSHVAILIGENKNGNSYVYLGGNQGNGDKRVGYQKISLGSVSKSSSTIYAIMKPEKYQVLDDEKKLPKYDVNSENDASSSR